MPVWARVLALGLALAWAPGCAATTGVESPAKDASADASADADTTSSADASAPSTARSIADRGGAPTQLSAPVAVVATPAADARPCERMCGQLGDCLRERDDLDAGYLEISCLDLCVNVDAKTPIAKKFRGCGSANACDPLLDCARSHWDAAAGARVEFVSEVLASPSYDVCELVCGGMHSCLSYEVPFHQLEQHDEQFEREFQSCISTCDPHLSQIIDLAACTNKETCLEQWECWRQAQNY